MSINYDNKRKDITFCTMLFRMPTQNLAAIKGGNRNFEEFYLASLKRLCETFNHVSLWCDAETANYLNKAGFKNKIHMKIMKLQDLPHWSERESCRKIMYKMKKYVGYFLHHRSPELWVDYLPLMWAKPAIIDWAAKNNKFKSDYFMWIDAGAFSPRYANSNLWNNWNGHIVARPKRVRMTIAITLGKSRPHFVPRFVYDLCKWLFVKPIEPANSHNLAKQNLRDIAMTNADYDVPGGCFMVPKNKAHDFYQAFERVRKIMKKHDLCCVDQGIFQAMMKFDVDDLFELKYIKGYKSLYALVTGKVYDTFA